MVESDNIALFVWLEAEGVRGRFSDNAFHMVQPSVTVIFHSKQSTSVKDLQNSLSIRSYKA